MCLESGGAGEVRTEYFASVFTSEICVECSNIQGQIEKDEVLGFLKNIKVDKPPGPDRIYPMILRNKGGDCRRLPKDLCLL